MTNPTPYALQSASLASAAIAALNGGLTTSLSWLTAAYGQGQRLEKEVDGKAIKYPAVYTGGMGGKDYLNLFPDEHLATLGGFSWWDVENPVRQLGSGLLHFRAGLVIWFDFRKVYPSPADWKAYDTWNVANLAINAIDGVGSAQLGEHIDIQDRPERIYPGLTHQNINRQYAMRPFGVFRLDMEITWSGDYC